MNHIQLFIAECEFVIFRYVLAVENYRNLGNAVVARSYVGYFRGHDRLKLVPLGYAYLRGYFELPVAVHFAVVNPVTGEGFQGYGSRRDVQHALNSGYFVIFRHVLARSVEDSDYLVLVGRFARLRLTAEHFDLFGMSV